MFIRSLSPEERKSVYFDRILGDIRPVSIKTYDYLELLHAQGVMHMYGLFDKGGELLGYAYIDRVEGLSLQLLDFFAVCAEHRDAGIGSRFLKLLTEKERFGPALVAEVEDPDAAEGEEKAPDERRIAFYDRADWKDTGLRADIEFYHCRLLSPSETLTENQLRRDLPKLYRAVLGEEAASGIRLFGQGAN